MSAPAAGGGRGGSFGVAEKRGAGAGCTMPPTSTKAPRATLWACPGASASDRTGAFPTADPPGLGLRPLRRGKTGPSTDQEVLDRLAADPSIDSPIPRLIVEYRQLTKLVNTYLTSLKEAINPRTNRIHASFNQTVAVTGRLADVRRLVQGG